MAATHLPTTLTTHTVQTTTFRMRSHLLFRKEGRRQQKIKKRKITLEGLMEKRNNNDRIMCMCAGLSNAAQTGEIKRWQRDWNQLFPLITYWGGWLKFSCRYSLYGCMEIIPDALQIRPTRGTGAYHSKKVTAVKYIDWALWIFLCQSWRCVTVCLLIKTSLRSVPRIGISVSSCLTVSDQMTGTASWIWGITAREQRNLRKEGMEICLSTSSFCF